MENPRLIDCLDDGHGPEPFSNITLRDLFAGLAMQALASRELGDNCYDEYKPGSVTSLTMRSYALADAMLAAREVK